MYYVPVFEECTKILHHHAHIKHQPFVSFDKWGLLRTLLGCGEDKRADKDIKVANGKRFETDFCVHSLFSMVVLVEVKGINLG
jgi:hypothetical protein